MKRLKDFDEFSQAVPRNKPYGFSLEIKAVRNPNYITPEDIVDVPVQPPVDSSGNPVPQPISAGWAYIYTQAQEEDHYVLDSLVKAILTVLLDIDFTEEDIEEIDWEEIAASEIQLPETSKTTILGTPTELTVLAGVVTVTRTYHTIDTEADAASDNLDTINGGEDGQVLILRPANDARTVVIKNGTGNIVCGTDATLDSDKDTWQGLYDTTLAKWIELMRSDNAP